MLAPFVLFAVFFLLFLIILTIYLYPGSRRKTTIPGLDPSDPKDGNIADIGQAGSLHEFLLDLHQDYGPVASFYLGQEFIVSISSPELFKEQIQLFDRPCSLYKLFEPLIGSQCIQYANSGDGKKRRKLYDPLFAHASMRNYYEPFHKVAAALTKKWKSTPPGDHIPLNTHMLASAIKSICLACYGPFFKDDKEVLQFSKEYEHAWGEMEASLTEGPPQPGTKREARFQKSVKYMKDTMDRLLKQRRDNPPGPQEELFVDALIESDFPPDVISQDALVYMVGGFHTTANLLTWLVYFLATHEDVQEKVYEELTKILGTSDLEPGTMGELVYLRQVIDETLRCSVLAPWAARFSTFDTLLGGHEVPKNTPVIHALGVSLQDSERWPDPTKFDPSRFDADKKKKIADCGFEPFGFAGKRKCPGYRFAYHEVGVFVSNLLRQVKVSLVEGQVVTPVHGLVTHPAEEVWITVTARK